MSLLASEYEPPQINVSKDINNLSQTKSFGLNTSSIDHANQQTNEVPSLLSNRSIQMVRSISSGSSSAKDIPLSLLSSNLHAHSNINTIENENESSTFTLNQYKKECIWPGLGLFGESYLLFSIGILKPIWEMLYPECFVTMEICSSSLIYGLTYSVVLGVICGMIVIGTMANHLGRRRGSLVTATFMSVSSILMVIITIMLSSEYPYTLFGGMIICLFIFGIGVGGEYPLSASSASERAMEEMRANFQKNKEYNGSHVVGNHDNTESDDTKPTKNIDNDISTITTINNRGKRILLVFTMQGFGIFMNTLTITLLLLLTGQFGKEGDLDGEKGNLSGLYNPNILLNIWISIYIIGAVILGYVLYSRYFYLEESLVWEEDHRSKQIMWYMEKDLENDAAQDSLTSNDNANNNRLSSIKNATDSDGYFLESSQNLEPVENSINNTYLLLIKNYWHRLFGTSMTWLLWDVAFYGNKLYQSKFLLALTGKDTTLIQLTGAATLNAFIALTGYFAAAFLVDKPYIGRYRLQAWGFLISSVLFTLCGITHDRLSPVGLVLIYFTSSFFGQCGPNATTFLIPAEIFPTEMRTMCHGISAAFGKFGALLAAILFNYSNDVQIFMISGFTSLVAYFITLWFIPESTQLDLFELDKKWHATVCGRMGKSEYIGPANDFQFSSFYERRFT